MLQNGTETSHLDRQLHQLFRVDFMSDKMPCIVLRGQWCDTVMNVHAPNENKSDVS